MYLLAEAADGYQVVYTASEFDSGFTDRLILIADRRDGQSLAEKEGPLRVVVPGEKRQARWLRQLISLRGSGPVKRELSRIDRPSRDHKDAGRPRVIWTFRSQPAT